MVHDIAAAQCGYTFQSYDWRLCLWSKIMHSFQSQ